MAHTLTHNQPYMLTHSHTSTKSLEPFSPTESFINTKHKNSQSFASPGLSFSSEQTAMTRLGWPSWWTRGQSITHGHVCHSCPASALSCQPHLPKQDLIAQLKEGGTLHRYEAMLHVGFWYGSSKVIYSGFLVLKHGKASEQFNHMQKSMFAVVMILPCTWEVSVVT